jgi:hypothetical protein
MAAVTLAMILWLQGYPTQAAERARQSVTATDLAALWAARGRRANARALLQPILEQFVEGSDTADVKAAERLLATLGFSKNRNV